MLYRLYVEPKKKKKIQMNLFTKQEQTHRHRKQTYVTKQETGEEGGDKLLVWDQQIHKTIHKIDKQQEPTVQHRELYSVSYNQHIMEKNLKKKNTYTNIYFFFL